MTNYVKIPKFRCRFFFFVVVVVVVVVEKVNKGQLKMANVNYEK